MDGLAGKVALVTGASRGLGAGIALVLAENGCDIIINFRSEKSKAEDVASQIRDTGRRAVIIMTDVSDKDPVDQLFNRIQQEFGKLDILINNAGTSQPKDIFEMKIQDWEFILNTNLKSCFLCSKRAMEMMKEREQGRIVNMSSVVGHQGALYGHVHYAATKSGILGFTKTLARTAAPFGITVNAVAPGIIETELLYETVGKAQVEKLAKATPLGLGKPRDIGLAVAFLCGEGGRYITGATIDVNGGMHMR